MLMICSYFGGKNGLLIPCLLRVLIRQRKLLKSAIVVNSLAAKYSSSNSPNLFRPFQTIWVSPEEVLHTTSMLTNNMVYIQKPVPLSLKYQNTASDSELANWHPSFQHSSFLLTVANHCICSKSCMSEYWQWLCHNVSKYVIWSTTMNWYISSSNLSNFLAKEVILGINMLASGFSHCSLE